jgi:hypothetical protein
MGCATSGPPEAPLTASGLSVIYGSKGLGREPQEAPNYWESVTNHNALCLNTVYVNTSQTLDGGIVRYTVPYEPTSTGRFKHPQKSKGGPLNFSREIKAYAYSGITVFNYDLENSQLVALYTLLERAGIESEWLTDCLTHPEGKAPYYTAAGVSKDTYKTILYAVLFGSPLPRPSGRVFEGEVWNAVEDEARAIGADPHQLYERVYRVLSPLDKECRQTLYAWLKDKYIPANKRHAKGRPFVGNVLDQPFWLDEQSTAVLPRKLAAHLLQGLEAYFIHTLTGLAPKYGFEPISNEHDGLISTTPIPEIAVEEAREITGLKYFKLIEKPFELTPLDELGDYPYEGEDDEEDAVGVAA